MRFARCGRALVTASVLVLAVGCRPSVAPAPAVDVVATSRSGVVTFAEVESELRGSALQSGPDGSVEALVDAYRRTAEEVIVRRVLDADAAGAADGSLAAERERYLRLAVAELYAQERLLVDLAVTEDEARSYFNRHPELFHRPARRTVQHLYRRHDDPDRPEVTVAFVESLRDRFMAGASFDSLAREHSHSETRAVGGRLGALSRGRLPPEFDEVVFALEVGKPSAPIVTADGVLLFLVTAAVDERDFPFDDARLLIARELQEQRRDAALEAAVVDLPLPAGSIVLDELGLAAVWSRGADEVVLEVDGVRWTVRELHDAFGEHQLKQAPPLAPDEELQRFYQRLVLAQRLYLQAVSEGFTEERRDAVEAASRRVTAARLHQRVVESRLGERLEATPERVRQFFEDNRYLYQTPLRLRLRTLEAPLGDQPAALAATLEAFRPDLEAGRTSLAEVAARVGGSVVEVGWVSPAELGVFEPKVRHYLLSMLGRGFTVVFQLNRRLLMVEVVDREEPHVRGLDEVAEQVRRDYLDRAKQVLYREMVDGILEEEGFTFDREAVERRLAGVAPAPGET